MAQKSNTIYKDNDLASDFHRISGRYNLFTDCDLIETNESEIDNMFFEYSQRNNKTEFFACIDFKMPGKSLSDKYSAIKAQIQLANNLKVHFYFIITYLDQRFPIKMYYVIPINQLARDCWKLSGNYGVWMSLKQHSKFQHKLRGIVWNANEAILDSNAAKVNLSNYKKLGDLSDAKAEYDLPSFEFSWSK